MKQFVCLFVSMCMLTMCSIVSAQDLSGTMGVPNQVSPRTTPTTATGSQTWSGLVAHYSYCKYSTGPSHLAYDMCEDIWLDTKAECLAMMNAVSTYDIADNFISHLQNLFQTPTHMWDDVNNRPTNAIPTSSPTVSGTEAAACYGGWLEYQYNSANGGIIQPMGWVAEELVRLESNATSAYGYATYVHNDRIANGNANYSSIDEALAINDAWLEIDRMNDLVQAFLDITYDYNSFNSPAVTYPLKADYTAIKTDYTTAGTNLTNLMDTIKAAQDQYGYFYGNYWYELIP